MAKPTQNATAAAAPKSTAVAARESLESIVVAFTLAFIFRAFIVEAFVIPTGSMAPTLYGQQITHTCSTCGFEYAHGVDQVLPEKPRDLRLRCPNCASERDRIAGRELLRPSSGDRILVHKWPFSLGGKLAADRWDVTVFKDPHNGTINYIKRLVGKPGEILQIIHGDIYAAGLEEVRDKDPWIVEQMDQLRRDLYAYSRGILHLEPDDVAARYEAINQRLIPYLKIQRKAVDAPQAQQSLWFNVYERDYLPNYEQTAEHHQPDVRVGWSTRIRSFNSVQPEQLDQGQVPPDVRRALEEAEIHLPDAAPVIVQDPGREWQVGNWVIAREDNRLAVHEAVARKAWNISRSHLEFASESDRVANLRFVGKPIDDFYAYNFGYPGHQTPPPVPVGDLRLAFVWFPQAGDGGLTMEMNRHQDHFLARLRMDGTAEIHHRPPGSAKTVLIGQANLGPFRPGQAVPVEFTNVDFRVSLSIDGQEVVASTDQQYAPDVAELLSRREDETGVTEYSQVAIGGYRTRFRISHLELDRDVYYRSSPIPEPRSPQAPPSQSGVWQHVTTNPFYRWPGWGTQGRPIMLRNGEIQEYFMLGDNSPGSKDSRLWWEIGPHLQHLGEDYQFGTVPHDQLIGQAFFVYWPSGYRRSWTADIGIIPNFGRMRWIR